MPWGQAQTHAWKPSGADLMRRWWLRAGTSRSRPCEGTSPGSMPNSTPSVPLIPRAALSDRVGHSNPAITFQIYAHRSAGRDRAAAQRIERLIEDAVPSGGVSHSRT